MMPPSSIRIASCPWCRSPPLRSAAIEPDQNDHGTIVRAFVHASLNAGSSCHEQERRSHRSVRADCPGTCLARVSVAGRYPASTLALAWPDGIGVPADSLLSQLPIV